MNTQTTRTTDREAERTAVPFALRAYGFAPKQNSGHDQAISW